jgi:hypothetical protein
MDMRTLKTDLKRKRYELNKIEELNCKKTKLTGV